jgi:hypothetical protein
MSLTTSLLLAAQSAGTDNANSSLWAPAIVAAVVAAAVSLTTFALTGRRTRLDRQRQVFADAFEAVMEYREYPFIIRRRNPDEPEKERQRLSSELSRVQARMNSYKARLLVEDPEIGKLYKELVKQTRIHAGAHIKSAWDNNPVSADDEMHAPKYDYTALDRHDDAYLRAVAEHLSWKPAWIGRSDTRANAG